MRNAIDPANNAGCLEVRAEQRADEQVIALAGELDLDGAGRVDDALRRAEATDARRIVLDLSGLDFIDSSGIRVVIGAEARSRGDGGRLTLIRGPRAVQRVFEISGIADRMPFAA